MSPLTRLTRTAWRPFEDFDHEFRPRFREPVSWSPPVELAETDDELLLRAELPGIERDAIEIEVERDVLTLRGEKNEERSKLARRGAITCGSDRTASSNEPSRCPARWM